MNISVIQLGIIACLSGSLLQVGRACQTKGWNAIVAWQQFGSSGYDLRHETMLHKHTPTDCGINVRNILKSFVAGWQIPIHTAATACLKWCRTSKMVEKRPDVTCHASNHQSLSNLTFPLTEVEFDGRASWWNRNLHLLRTSDANSHLHNCALFEWLALWVRTTGHRQLHEWYLEPHKPIENW